MTHSHLFLKDFRSLGRFFPKFEEVIDYTSKVDRHIDVYRIFQHYCLPSNLASLF